MHHRLATIATTLRIQDATGASHLQQLEMHPEAYGVANSVRPHVKSLRRQRNRALHGTSPGSEGARTTARALPAKTTGNISATTPFAEVASTTANTFSVKTEGNNRATTPVSEVASTTANTFPVTTTGNTSSPHSTRHRHYGSRLDGFVNHLLASIRGFDPDFQCPDLSPRALALALSETEIDYQLRFGDDSGGMT